MNIGLETFTMRENLSMLGESITMKIVLIRRLVISRQPSLQRQPEQKEVKTT